MYVEYSVMPQLVGGLWRVDDGVSRVAWFLPHQWVEANLWLYYNERPPRTN
jgi:hypothetical protein